MDIHHIPSDPQPGALHHCLTFFNNQVVTKNRSIYLFTMFGWLYVLGLCWEKNTAPALRDFITEIIHNGKNILKESEKMSHNSHSLLVRKLLYYIATATNKGSKFEKLSRYRMNTICQSWLKRKRGSKEDSDFPSVRDCEDEQPVADVEGQDMGKKWWVSFQVWLSELS